MNPENDQIAAPNPPGAVIGQSGVFTVTAPSTATAAPYISRIDPVSTLTPGGAVTLDGQNFDSGSYVDLDGIQSINPGAYASTYFDFMLPSNVSVGSHTIWIGEKASGVTSNQVTMTISAAGCTSSSGYSSTNGEPCAPTATISQVQNLTATASGTSINLSWSAATATNGVMQYLIYRSTTPGFAPSESNRIAEGNTLLYADSNLSPDTYYYVVAAMDMQSNIGLASAQTSATVAGSSTITPSITILSPTSGGGTLTVGESIPYSVQVTTNKTVGAFGLLLTSVNKGWPGSPATYMSLTDSGGDVAVPTNGIYSGTATYPGKYGGSLPPGNYYLAAEWNIPDQTENLYTYSNFVYTIMTVSAPVAPILSQVQNLTATASGSSVNLSWSAATATNGVMQYLIYRSTTPGFTPSESNMIAEGNTLSYMDANLSPSTYYYVVAAMDMQSNLGAASAQASATIANTIIITPTPISPTPCKAPSLCPVPVVPIKLQTSASDTSDQTAIISQSLQSLLNQLSVLLKSL
jgi:hypothetical protein